MRRWSNVRRIALLILVPVLLCSAALSHSGRTDSKGGHWNRSTGEYHYHHGYGPHQHTNGICPYDYKDKTASSSSKSTTSDAKASKKRLTLGQALLVSTVCPLPVVPFIIAIVTSVRKR